METDQTEYFEKTLQTLCYLTSQIMQSNKINSTEYKQKIFALASFLEFIKAGADVSVETRNDNKINFVINLK